MSNHGQVWWTELNTWDAHKAMAYYGAVLDWTFDEVPTAGADEHRPYYIANAGDRAVAGIFTMIKPTFEGVPEHWFTYLAVDDLAEALKVSEARGGKLLRAPFDIARFGRLAVVADTNGGATGLIEPVGEEG